MSGDAINERTPLIRQDIQGKPNYKRTYHVYGITLGFLFLFSFFIHWYRTMLPVPLSDSQAKALDDFAGIHAYDEYLSRFTAPHSANTRENGIMKDWLVSVVTDLQNDAIKNNVKVDIIANDTSKDIIAQDWFIQNEKWYIESRNVIVRLHGSSGKDDALLINAHYDSVPTSNGVTDNGMGVVTTLELLRYFIAHPPRHTIIFLLNNMEEGGLIGAQSFIHHPWYSSVKLFINLEGAGAGGRAVLFRCSNLNAVKKLASSSAAFKHSSPLGNDMFKMQLIKSDTDYSVFTKNGVPGLDIAFYAPRSHYHTPRDDLAHTTPEALQYMGQLALGAVKSIVNSDDLIDITAEQDSLIYYDILGRVMFVYGFTPYQIMNVLALIIVPVIAVFLTIKFDQQHHRVSDVLKQKLLLTFYGFVAVFAVFVMSILFTGIAAFAMSKINPSMTYGDAYGAALYIFSSAFLGLQVSQLIMPNKIKEALRYTHASWYGLIAFWWVFMIITIYTASRGIASLYYVIYLLAFNSIATLVHVMLPSDKKFRSPAIFFTQTIVPFVLLLEFEFLIMDSMRHATADGTPEIAVYILMAIPLIQIITLFVPWVYVAENQKRSTMGALIAFVFLFTICSALQPFNGGWSPNKLAFRQEYTAGDTLATVSLTTATGIQSILKSALSSHEYKTLQCQPFKKFLTHCKYQTDLLPKYGSNTTLNEYVYSNVIKHCDDTNCIASATFSSKNSLMCRVSFDPAKNPQGIQHAWVNDHEIKSDNITSLITYINEYERNVKFSVKYPVHALAPQATLGCFYDEWTHLELPAFTTLRDNLPANAQIVIRGQGLAFVNYANLTL